MSLMFVGIILNIPINEFEQITENNTISERNIQIKNPDSSNGIAEWTWMVYLDADCNLEEVGIEDINEMEMVGSTEDINIIVQIDRHPDYDDSNGDWTEGRRYKITQDLDVGIIGSTMVESLGEVNMGDPATLSEFIDWTQINYPAEKYALILWDHGSGPMSGIQIGGVCWDDTDGYDYLSIPEIYSALNTRDIDLLGFDACLLGSMEVFYELKDVADVIIGSEDVEPGQGYPYNEILNWLVGNPSASAEQLSTRIVNEYYDWYNTYIPNFNVTQTAVRTSKLNDLADAIDILGNYIIYSSTDFVSEVDIALMNTQYF